MKFQIINRNKGIALFIALIFLMVTTLLGVSTLQTNLFGEKMTHNSIQREKALEAAEGALLEGEIFVRDFKNQIIDQVINAVSGYGPPTSNAENCTATLNGAGGLCVPIEFTSSYGANSLEQWVDISGSSNSNNVWSTTGRHRKASNDLRNRYGLLSAPRYIVEFLGYVSNAGGSTGCDASLPGIDPSLAAQAATWPFCSQDRMLFRITALATAGNYDETRVMLQSTYVVDQ